MQDRAWLPPVYTETAPGNVVFTAATAMTWRQRSRQNLNPIKPELILENTQSEFSTGQSRHSRVTAESRIDRPSGSLNPPPSRRGRRKAGGYASPTEDSKYYNLLILIETYQNRKLICKITPHL